MIRAATANDITPLLILGSKMHQESPRFRERNFDMLKVAKLMHWLVTDENGMLLVAERDGQIVGGMLALVAEDYFGSDLQASELALYVNPDKRGCMSGVRLLRGYVDWAMARGVVHGSIQAGISTGVHPERTGRMYELAGFRQVGGLFEYGG